MSGNQEGSSSWKVLSKQPWNTLILICLALVLGIWTAYFLQETRIRQDEIHISSRNETMYIPDLRLIRLMSLGHDQAAADLLWLRTIGYFARHFNTDRQYPWLEHLLDQIIALDPKFRRVYHWAGANVLYGQKFTNPNVLRSSRFYELALQHFPDDYEAAYRLGLNYYIEMQSKDKEEKRKYEEKGLEYLELAANLPNAPANLRSLVASISRRLGKEQIALQYYIDQFIRADDNETRLGLSNKIKALRGETTQTDYYVEEAEKFQQAWKGKHPYLIPSLFSLIDQPEPRDENWRSLIPDIQLDN